MPALAAALWLLGLYAAAPALRGREPYGGVDRLRDALVLGVTIPLVLGLLHALYPVTCWLALAAAAGVALHRRGMRASAANAIPGPYPYLTLAALIAVAWPQLIRPLLDGDSLSYHLPNAASWVQAHSLWTAVTHYWWYPPGSELFAGGLYAVASPFALPWSGFAALALIGFRIATIARSRYAAPPLLADALAAATITAYPLAIQGGTLQNDVWLAAFWVEGLVALTASGDAVAMRSVALTALIKPQGWILAAIALATTRARLRVWLAAAAAVAVWILRDALLWTHAAARAPAVPSSDLFATTIAAHGAPALVLLARVTLAISPFALVTLVAALVAAPFARTQRALAWSAFAAAVLFFVLPYGYATSVAQLATGESLRFAAPAIAGGALALLPALVRFPRIASALCIASAIFGAGYVLAIFWNDGSTHSAVAVAVLAVAVAAAARSVRRPWIDAVGVGLAVIAATYFAGRHPIDYYTDSLRVGNVSPGLYRWVAAQRPAAVGGWGLRLGVVNVISPQTRTIDLPDEETCAAARRFRVLLVAVAQSDRAPESNARRLGAARQCGRIVYEDPISVAAEP